MSEFLSKNEILKADDLACDVVDVPEWNGKVRIKMLTGTERDAFEQGILSTNRSGQAKRNLSNIRAKLSALSIVNEEGERLFTDGEMFQLGRKSAKALDKIFDACQHLNGMTEDDVEDMAKNSEPDLNEDFISD